MPNNSGVYVYVDTSTTPWKGVSWDDVRKVLGISATDEATLCTSNKINRWAMYKPIRYAGPSSGYDRRNGWTQPIFYNTRKAANFGLEVPYCIEWQDMDWHSNCMNGMAYDILFNQDVYRAWKYLKPQGDYRKAAQDPRAEFFRVSDFARHPSDTDDPNYNPSNTRVIGYNKNAGVPFCAYLDMQGATEKDEVGSVNRYEINRTATQNITVTFYNGYGSEIRLQDLINFNYNEGTGDNDRAWRPVIQVWNSDVVSTSQDEQERLPWYQRNKPTIQVAGNPITNDSSASWSVSLPIGTGTYFDNYVNVNTLFRMCLGVGCCKKNPSASNAWKNETDSLFILPYDDDVEGDVFWAFYYEFKIVSYFDRNLQFVTLRYGTNTAQFVGSGVDIPYGSSGTVGFVMTIKQNDVPLHFVGEHGESTLYSTLKIALEDPETHTYYYLIPMNQSWQQTQYAYVEAGTGTTTLYGATPDINVRDIPNGGYGRYQVKAIIEGASPENANAISIHKLNQ